MTVLETARYTLQSWSSSDGSDLAQTSPSLQPKLSCFHPVLPWPCVVTHWKCCMWQLFEGVCNLLDRLGAWPHLANSIPALCEMAQIGLRLVLGYILLEDPQVSEHACGPWGWSWWGWSNQ